MGVIAYNYLRQLTFGSSDEYKFVNYSRDNLIRLLIEMGKSVYGTLIVTNDYNSYLNFKSIYDNFNIFRNRLFEVEDETGLNTILLAPSNFNHFNSFKRIIFIDPPLNMGYVAALNKATKSAVYLPYKSKYSYSAFREISLNRNVFGEYFKLLKFAHENGISATSSYQLFLRVTTAAKRKNCSYLQFMICMETFKELGIITTENDCKITGISMDKKELTSSVFYNRLIAVKSSK